MKSDDDKRRELLDDYTAKIHAACAAFRKRLAETRKVIAREIETNPACENYWRRFFKARNPGLSEEQVDAFFRGDLNQLVESFFKAQCASIIADGESHSFPA